MKLSRWLQLLDRRSKTPLQTRRAKRPSSRPGLEVLESRLAPAFLVGPNFNITKSGADDAEDAIISNPTNPNNLFASSTGSNAFKYSLDAGATWNNSDISGVLGGSSGGDQQEAWDSFGNLFMTYFAGGNNDTVVALSIDGGKTFTLSLDTGIFADQPNIAVGGGSVWVDYTNNGREARGAPVTGLGQVGTWTGAQKPPGNVGTFGDLAVGPNGQVMAVYQEQTGQSPSRMYVSVDPDGVGPQGYGTQINLGTTNVGDFDFITPQPSRSVDSEMNLAWDRSGGPNNGRVYLVNTEENPDESNDTDIYVRFSDDNGTTWSTPVRINDDPIGNGKAQFNPGIALDQTTGGVAVAWYDCRNDAGNLRTEVWGTASTDGGLTFDPNQQISQGSSIHPNSGFDYGDYNKATFDNGVFYYAWGDNSNSTGDNPAGAGGALDIYSAAVTVLPSTPETSVTLDGSGNLVITDINGGTTDDRLTVQADAANNRFVIKDANVVLTCATIAGSTGNLSKSVTVPFAAVTGGKIIFNTLGGDDVVTIDHSLGAVTKDLDVDAGGGNDTVGLTANTNFVITSAGLTPAVGGVVQLTNAEAATVTGGNAANSFTVDSWVVTTTLTLAGGTGNDTYFLDADVTLGTIIITESGVGGNDLVSFANTTANVTVNLGINVTQTVNANLNLRFSSVSGMEQVIGGSGNDALTGNALANSLTGGAGNDTLTGGAGDDVYFYDCDTPTGVDRIDETGGGIDTLNASATTTKALTINLATGGNLTASGDAVTFALGSVVENAIGGTLGDTLTGNAANNVLNGGLGADTYNFDSDSQLGQDTLVETGTDVDVLNFSATDTVVITCDLSLAGIQVVNANLQLALGADDAFEQVIGGAKNDRLTGNKLNNFISGLGGDDLLTGGSGSDTFLGGTGNDTVVETRNVNFTLTNATLVIGAEGVDVFQDIIEAANLTGGPAANSFTITDWTGTGLLDGKTGTDVVIATNDLSFVLTNTSLARTTRGTMTLASMENAILTGGASDNVFTVSGWTGQATLDAMGQATQDRIIHAADADIVLSNTLLQRSGLPSITIAGFEFAELQSLANGHNFDLTNWTNAGAIEGFGGSDTVTATNDVDFTLTDFGLERSGLPAIELTFVENANLTGGASDNSFFLTNWTGAGTFDGQAGADAIFDEGDHDFSLSDVSLGRGASALSIANIETAELTGGDSANTFTVLGWTGTALLDGRAAGDTYNFSFNGVSGNTTIKDTGDFGQDRVFANGTVNSDVINILAGRVGLGGENLNFKSIEGLSIDGLAGNDTFNSKATNLDKGIGALNLFGGLGNDTFFVTPANVAINIDGNDPVAPALPGDYLSVLFNGAKMKSLKFPKKGAGIYKFTNRKDVTFTNIESGRGAGGKPDLLP